MHWRQLALLLLVCGSVFLVGCVGSNQDAGSSSPTVEQDAAGVESDAASPTEQRAGDSDASGGNGGDAGQEDRSTADVSAQNRQLIRTGNIRLVVDDANETRDEVRDLTGDTGGYVSGSEREVRTRENGRWTVVRFELRVPASEFDATMSELETYGDVQEASTSTEDVTEQLVDLEARLENLRAERDRLRELYENAENTEAVLEVQRELANTQQEIERLEAKKRSLEDQVAMSTITVVITEQEPETPEDPAWYDVGVLDALGTSFGLLVTTIRATVIAVVYAVPFALVLAVPLGVGGILYRRRSG